MTTTASIAAQVAFFPNCRAKAGGRNVAFADILSQTREGRWAQLVGELRGVPYKSSAYEAIKTRLPCLMLSASTATGGHRESDIMHHTGLLQLDVDAVGEDEAAALRDRLATDPHILAAWISPGGVGVKGAMLVPSDLAGHRRAFKAARDYILARYGVEIDRQCSDPCRLCFVSFDPDLKLNPAASPLVVDAMPALPPEARFDGVRHAPEGDSSTSLTPDSDSAFTSCLLHNKEDKDDLFRDFPLLLPVYEQHVRRRLGIPQRGLRNAALLELVAGTFCVVHPRFVLAFADVFHRENPDTFDGYPHELWMREAQCALTGCLSDYAIKNLGPPEMALYSELRDDDRAAAAFRICRSLALCESNTSVPPPEFYLSAVQLAARLGMLDMQAWRIMQALEKRGAVQTVAKGTRRMAGTKATATRWRWSFPLQPLP